MVWPFLEHSSFQIWSKPLGLRAQGAGVIFWGCPEMDIPTLIRGQAPTILVVLCLLIRCIQKFRTRLTFGGGLAQVSF